MSRIGKQPIPIPGKVQVNISGNEVTVKGPKGELKRSFHPEMQISLENSVISVSRPSDGRLHRQLHGLTRTLVANMVKGVTDGFEKSLEISGVGYKAQKVKDNVTLQVGYTHILDITPPPGISFQVESPTRVKIMGIDKEAVGQAAANLHARRLPDAYKGKGIRYAGQKIRQKAGKAGKAAGKKK
ncbi:MAG: 50S ribosomal protein L6 [Chloroflexi bacterium]|nr:50S ribosomal protein L6 [Chloroflexota bacterium]